MGTTRSLDAKIKLPKTVFLFCLGYSSSPLWAEDPCLFFSFFEVFLNWEKKLSNIQFVHWGLRTKQRATFGKHMHQNKNSTVLISASIFQICSTQAVFFLTKRQQFFIVEVFKTRVEPRAAGEWFHCKVWAVLTSFLWPIRVQIMENCCRFVFCNNTGKFWCPFTLKLIGESNARERKKQIVPSSQTSFPWSVLLSKTTLDRSACEKSLSNG